MKNLIFIIVLLIALSACQNTEKQPKVNGHSNATKLKVAVFNGLGTGPISVLETLEALRIDTGIFIQTISAAEIQSGKLDEFDALILPGGSGSKELNNLGKVGKAIINKFIREDGKGIVGICAGGYLLSSTADYPSLDIASSEHLDKTHYDRGHGLIEFSLTKTGYLIFPELEGFKTFAQYYDGPVLGRINPKKGYYQEVATYVTDIHPDNKAPKGITPGRTFMLNEKVENGRVFISAGHPEFTPGMRWMVPRMVRWVCNSSLVSYNTKWVHPEINDSAIIFTSQLAKHEKQLFWKLFSDSSEVQINAMILLYEIRSHSAARWYIGMLRDTNPKTRKQAAILLKKMEYTYALSDLEQASKLEKNEDTKESINESINFLKTF